MDPELKEIEEWEAAALVAIEAWERQRDHKRRRGAEQDRDEMQKRRHVEELQQQRMRGRSSCRCFSLNVVKVSS